MATYADHSGVLEINDIQRPIKRVHYVNTNYKMRIDRSFFAVGKSASMMKKSTKINDDDETGSGYG